MNNKLILKWDIGILNKMIGLAYKKSRNITLFNLRNLQELIRNSDFSLYENKNMIIKRVQFLSRSLEAKLDHKFADESIIINYAVEDANDPTMEEIVNNLPKYKQLNYREIEYLNKLIEDRLRYGSLETFLDDMTTIIDKIQNGEYATYSEAFLWVDNWINDFKHEMRRIRSELNNGVLRFNDPNIEERVADILEKLGTTQSIIISGMQMLNELLAPGYRGGKLYTYAALPANFKSGILLKTAIDCIKYNAKTYRGKKDSHKKCVIYFTMENTTEESFERTYNMTISKDDVINHDSKSIVADMRKANITGNDEMELIMVYKPNRSITTEDIRHFIEELDEENMEVVMLCFDYLKRIRPFERGTNEKEELKNVTNELRQIGIDFDIPVVTAAQLNRQAASIINNAVRSGKADALKEIDTSAIGSAWEIIENSDVVIYLNMQKRRKDNKLFLSFALCKNRYKLPELQFFNQPFEEDTFNLADDILCKTPKGVTSLATDFDDVDLDLYEKRGRTNHLADSGRAANVENDLFDLNPLS